MKFTESVRQKPKYVQSVVSKNTVLTVGPADAPTGKVVYAVGDLDAGGTVFVHPPFTITTLVDDALLWGLVKGRVRWALNWKRLFGRATVTGRNNENKLKSGTPDQ